MGDVSSYAVSTSVLPPLSIKVQVVTMVWHSLSACGFAGLAPAQLGCAGCQNHSSAAVKDRRARAECCPPCLRDKDPLTTAAGQLGARCLTSLIHFKALSQETAHCEELK